MVVEAHRWSRRVALCWVWLGVLVGGAQGSCAPPPAWPYAVPEDAPVGDSFAVGDTLTYVCDAKKGFLNAADDVGTIVCLEDSTWSKLELICDAGCGEPPRFQYGELMEKFLLVKAFAVGSLVTYRCRPGFTLKPRTPRPIIKCLAPKKWTERAEFCQRRDCGNPGEPQNGRVHLKDGEDDMPDTYFGSEATFSCLTGFTLVGRKTRICEATGWSNAVPVCEPVTCDEPPDTPNGRHSGYGQEDFYYLSAVTYSCTADYLELLGNHLIHCTEKGTWSGPAPTCKDRRCPKPAVENGRQITGFKVQYLFSDKVEFSCNEGFITKNERHVQCGEENKWVPKLPICQPIVCGPPPLIENGTHDGLDREEFEYRKVVRYRCANEELSMIGADTIQCVGEDRWSGPAPRCKDQRCPLPEVKNLKRIIPWRPVFVQSDIISVECDLGFVLVGKAVIRCTQNNRWVPPFPACRPVTCRQPPEIVDGTHSGTSQETFGYQETVDYQCDSDDLSLIGTKTITCQEDETWSHAAPTCQAVCPKPLITNGRATDHSVMKPKKWNFYRYNDTVEIKCRLNFNISGTPMIRCTETGKWSDLPLCKPVLCQEPSIENGSVLPITDRPGKLAGELVYDVSSLAEVRCNSGYTLNGTERIQCQANSEWSPLPTCHPELCQEPSIENGSVLPISDRPGKLTGELVYGVSSLAEVRCNSGYTLNGTEIIQCQANSEWSPLPTCHPVRCNEPTVENGQIVCRQMKTPEQQSGFRLHDNITFHCDAGFTMRGAKMVQCVADSVWSAPPTCEADERAVEPTQCPPRLLPLGKRNLTEAELSNFHDEMVFPASSEEICKSVMKGLQEDWERMNFEDKWTYLQMKKLCMEIGNSELRE